MNQRSNHFDDKGNAHMVDVSEKVTTVRVATASADVIMKGETAKTIQAAKISKGDVLGIARIAGIQAAKSTAQLIPLCHTIPIEAVSVRFAWTANDADSNRATLNCIVEVRTSAKTGVEMEAMTAASIACLTVYDMIKSADRTAVITNLRLIQKSGGKSGDFQSS